MGEGAKRTRGRSIPRILSRGESALSYSAMASPSHPVVLAVGQAAEAALGEPAAGSQPFWRRLFQPRHQHSFEGSVRFFGHVLKKVLDVPPTMLTPDDLASLGLDVNRVVKEVEARLAQADAEHADEAGLLTAAVYAIRSRYELIYQRGALKQG